MPKEAEFIGKLTTRLTSILLAVFIPIAGAGAGEPADTISRSSLQHAQRAWLPNGHRLVGLENHLYRIDSHRRVLWEHEEQQLVFDFVFVESRDLVYVTAGDNNFCILDGNSGKELHRVSRNGSAAFGEVHRYKHDQCLVTDNNWGYREKGFRDHPDGVSAWRGTELLWHRTIPAEASIQVEGHKIFTVYQRRGATIRARVLPPRQSRVPSG